MSTAHDQAPTHTSSTILDLAADVSAALVDLDVLTALVHELVDTHQRNLGFLTPAARMAQDRLIEAERRARVDDTPRPLGHGFMRGTPAITGSGHVRSAGNITAMSVEADVTFTLTHVGRRIVRALDRAGVCALTRLPSEPTTREQINHVRALVWTAPSAPLLASVYADVQRLVDDATFVVEGDDRTQLGDCPHCALPTLVVYFATGIVRCDRDPRTGHYAPCWCPDSYCDCKRSPVTHRHEWHRDRGTSADGWWALSDRLNLARSSDS